MKKNSPGGANGPRRRTSPPGPERNTSVNEQGIRGGSTAPEKVNPVSLLNEVERLLHFAHSGSYYELLGAGPDSPRSEFKHRFYQLARQFHPDRHMDHPDWTSRLQMLMDSLSIAYRTLSDEAAKRVYDSRAEADSQERQLPKAPLSSEDFLKNSQKCVKARNYVGSVLWLRRAIELEPYSFAFRVMLARSLAAIPEYRQEAVEQFEQAIRLDSTNIAAHFEYAQLLEKLKFPLRARPHYARVLELDPHHVQARQRLNELDVKSPQSISRVSLLTRLAGRRLIRP